MENKNLRSLSVELTQRDMRYILHAVNELMKKLEQEIEKDPDGEDDLTPMYADDVLNLNDICRLKEKAMPVFGERGLTVSYKTL